MGAAKGLTTTGIGEGEPLWFTTLLSSIETSISRCIEPYAQISDLVARAPESISFDGPSTFVMPLSARSPEELDNLVWWWTNVLEDSSVSLARSCAIAALRRHHPHRAAVVASTREGMVQGLRSLAAEKLVLFCEPGTSSTHVRLGVLHVRGKWVDWRSLYGGPRLRLFTGSG